MSRIAIYMEGGGDSASQKSRLRQGMDAFLADLKDAARTSRRRWKLVPCGGRRAAYEAFVNARNHAEDGEIVVLLVDSEAPVAATTAAAAHLASRPGDGWNLAGVPEDRVHLMVQTMETWIVADPEALAAYYGQHFTADALPARQDLEAESKNAVARALETATRRTQKGSYHKIRHASDLLGLIDPARVRRRCERCERLFNELGLVIQRA